MNICFVSSHNLDPTYGGTERVSHNLSQELVKRGNNVYYCYLFDVPNKEFKSSLLGVKLPSSEFYNIDNSIRVLNRFICENKIDVLMFQSHHLIMWDICVAAKKSTNAKLIYNLHSDPLHPVKEIFDKFAINSVKKCNVRKAYNNIFNICKLPLTYYQRTKFISTQYKKYYSECDAFVSLSDKFTPIVAKLVGAKGISKFYAITNPILQNDSIYREKKRQIVFVGRMVIPHKRPDRVLDIWKNIYNKYNDWNLVMIGHGPDLDYLINYSSKLGLERVTFTGQTNPMPYFSESWISCVTSSHEGFGMVLVEAQQNGCIPVAYDSYESLHDIIKNGENGIIVPAFNKNKYTQEISSLIDDVEQRERISDNCRKQTNKFDVATIVDQWELLFKKLLS